MSKAQASSQRFSKLVVRWRWIRYLGLGLAANVCIWGFAIFYLKVTKPTYISEWALILPGSGTGVSVNIPEIGQASSSSSSAFGSASSDPRANYNFVLTSEPVLAAAAASMKMPVKKFGKPRIKVIDNTTIMHLEVSGSSPKEAQQKSLALYKAFTQQLNLLRAEAVASRDAGTQKTLLSAKSKLEAAQSRLSQYKARSGLGFVDQIKDLSVNIEQLRKQRAEALAQQQQATNRLQQLSTNLGLSAQQAADAFTLQSDQVFQQNLKEYSESSATLTVFLSKWGPNHPEVVKQRVRQEATQAALLARSSSILNRTVDLQTLKRLNLSDTASGAGRANLFQQLIAVEVERQGVIGQSQVLNQQIHLLEKRLQTLAEKESRLENLQRDVEITQAIFASTVAKLDLGKADIFVDYPLVQFLVKPTLPEAASAPKKSFVLAGAFLGSLLVTTGLILLWWRQRLSHEIARSISKIST